MRVINFEDSGSKHSDIKKVLRQCGIGDIAWVRNMSDGLNMMEEAQKAEKPFDLVITDMHYQLTPSGKDDLNAGEKLISELKERGNGVKIIVCSSRNIRIKDIYGCVWYSKLGDWESDLEELVKKLK